ncbi:transcriptional regulator [Synechococcus sp. PCC 7502]|uniref:TetR/AcrR family transcriptional regulator n=1 Tax=Synechococcus sp. PCC 7502 TaxID=1173263 RepID=UPI00029FDCE2|nr:TetR/AcrR family transcriptional regulator [Synechococcus sp. PCC 7502]AFY73789.1 transcriptional regulator [Synechococcus sp. PCC 7502]
MTNVKRTREDILEAVLELIHRQGFQSTGLKELFTVSQTSSGSFYNYFHSKDDLAHALIDFKWEKIKSGFLKIANDKDDWADNVIAQKAIAKVYALIDFMEASHAEELDCSGCFLGNLIVDLVAYDPSFRTHLIEIFNQWQELIAQLLHQAKNQLKPEINPDMLAEEILTVMQGTLLMNRLYNQSDRLHRGFNLMRSLVNAALIP